MLYPDGCIMVFCKAPEPGLVKTRLATTIGTEAAATVHAYLAWHCLEKLAATNIAPIELWCAPDTNHDFFQHCQTEFGVTLKRQEGGSLGQRMENAFLDTLSSRRCAVVIGTDCPMITPAYLASAFSGLENHDSVLGPAEDGGYVLLGLRKPQSDIFVNMPWGSAQVFKETMSRLKGEVKSLATLWDVDYIDDLIRLRNSAFEMRLGREFSKYLSGIEC